MLVLALLLSQAATTPPSPAIVPAPADAGRFHVLRTTSGSRGTPDKDRFLIEDPRLLFHLGHDRQVLVLFEWRGPLGPHHCEGVWKDPSGRAVLTSQSDLVARGPRFGVYWGLSLSDTVATGTWLVEARIDGEPAGVHAFQVVSSAPDGSGRPVRRPLSVTELYRRGLALTLTAEALDASGVVQARGSGVLVAPGLVQVGFSIINAARAVRIILPDARRFETSEVVSWNYGEGWAVLRVAGLGDPAAERSAESPVVGDRVFFLDGSADGTRIIQDTSVVGRSAQGELVLGQRASGVAEGAPVLNEYGEVAATVVIHRLLGASDRDAWRIGGPNPVTETLSAGCRARPLGASPGAAVASKTFLDLEKAGVFVRPLAQTKHFVSAVMGTGVSRDQGIPVAVGQASHFSRRDPECVVFVTWTPHAKQDARINMELYDDANRRISVSDPKPAKLRPGESFVQVWPLHLQALQQGVYRVDVLLESAPVFRSFFSVTD